MFVWTAQELIDKFARDIESGWLRPGDKIAFDYWTYDDVKFVSENISEFDDEPLTDVDARRRGDIVLYDTFKVDAISAGETFVEFVREV